jgi:H+/Cl- antiporter ClcA
LYGIADYNNVNANKTIIGNIMNFKLTYWFKWANRILLALEGILLGITAGIVICCFRLSKDISTPILLDWISEWQNTLWIIPIWITGLIITARFLGSLVQKVPMISGSGIPQTELVVSGHLHLSRNDWLKVLPAKFIGCLVSTLSGLSLGREGPCIQMGAATASLVSGLWEKFSFSGKIHIAAGAAAGMTAAFGSPIAGFFFVFEEMKTRITWNGILIVFSAVCSSAVVTRFCFGFGFIFPFQDIKGLQMSHLWLLPLMGIIMGITGVFYNKALLGTKNTEAKYNPLPQQWRILPPIGIAGILTLFCPAVLGGGEGLVASLGELSCNSDSLLTFLLILTILKILFALISYTGNVPGGILMPMLCIGALLGALCGQSFLSMNWITSSEWKSFIIYGMVGFFVSMVRVPLTGTALVLEMSGAILCLPGACAVAWIASWTATRLHCPPVYDSLRAAIVIPKRI